MNLSECQSLFPLLEIQENVSLQAYNTLAIPAFSRWFIHIDDEQYLQQALCFYREHIASQSCPLLVVAGGSNIVLNSDFPGLCLHIASRGRHIEASNGDSVDLSLAAGESWHDTVMYCVDNHFYGLENLALIPGTVGAAPIQNIGAYGVELKDCFHYLEAIEIQTGKRIILDKQACEFAYRDSIFKHRLQDQVIIVRVVLRLSKTPCWTLHYPALRRYLIDSCHIDPPECAGSREGALLSQGIDGSSDCTELTLASVAKAVIAIRQAKLPDPRVLPNAGSFFKNPIVNTDDYQRIKAQFPNVVTYPQGSQQYKLAAGWLLDNAGWRGKEYQQLAMHRDQALVLTNPHRVPGQQLMTFVDEVRADIESCYGIRLEIEPRVIGSMA